MSSNTLPRGNRGRDRQIRFFPEEACASSDLEQDWRGEIAQRVAAHKSRGEDPSAAGADFSPPRGDGRAAAISQRALENVRRRMAEREAREAAERREREELELFFAATEQPRTMEPATSSCPKVIEFPRTATLMNEPAHEGTSVRILEQAPADQLTIFEDQRTSGADPRSSSWHFHPVRPVFSALRLDDASDFASALESEPRADQSFELPLKVASIRLRGLAAAADLAIVLCCASLFAMTFYGIHHHVPVGKSAFVSAVLVLWTLWVLYQFLFLAYAGSTPGLRLARLGISDFQDRVPDTRVRVARAGALVLSSLSCGLGFIWALLDEDRLAWHDRMTRTFPRELA